MCRLINNLVTANQVIQQQTQTANPQHALNAQQAKQQALTNQPALLVHLANANVQATNTLPSSLVSSLAQIATQVSSQKPLTQLDLSLTTAAQHALSKAKSGPQQNSHATAQ